MINSSEINDLPSKTISSNFGLSQKEVDRIYNTDPNDDSLEFTGYSLSVGCAICWGIWFWCTIGWWEWKRLGWFPGIMLSVFVGVIPCFLIGMYLASQISKKIERRFISKEKIDAYHEFDKAKNEAEERYLSTYKQMGISIESRFFVDRRKDADKIIEKWSDLFFDPIIKGAHFISTQILPIPKNEMERFFKEEIFIEQWAGENTNYLESLKTNLIINLPRFIDINTKILNDPIIEIGNATKRAKEQGVPIAYNQFSSKIEKLMKSEECDTFLKFTKEEKEETDRNSAWISLLEELIKKTKQFDELFFYIYRRQ